MGDQSQKEVWDDSELRNAFETALHEFKKYHSIEAKGYDETYKKLIMSWYYAGYYTGLAEGLAKSEQRKD
uniref:Survival motor neuron-like protein 1,Survival motor neuron-like protein 1 n=1 Tax=Schizosaccharomyces pombe (strain 972 / ATCC 24843) TaxID=284812 RepID=UPI0019112553|nr:Chain A, Survival motor neuron-like protein 1,Survival motor neuron-like protein 1 [Schizosaccharomyces pombe 972h-]7BB3_B Chain B, Survival motor neuron-like protein 1,Survival motor neuron-like protein 1 [Schizosaccharomyces pombe 972h-]